MADKRESGYYWVKMDETPWFLAQYFQSCDGWEFIGLGTRMFGDELFVEINNQRIFAPDQCQHCGANDPFCQCWNDE